MATASSPTAGTQAPVNHLGRLFGALFGSKATFADMAARPSWVAPIAILTILSLGFSYVMNQRMDWGSYIRQQAEKNPRFAQLTEEQKERALGPQAKLAPIFAYVIGALGNGVLALFLALVFWGAFNLLAGAGIRFGASFGVSAHAILPGLVSGALGIVIMYLKKPGEVDPEHLVAANLGALVSGDSPKWLEKLAASVDLFWIWILFLLAIGFAAANPKKVSIGKAVGIVFGVYAVLRLVVVCWAAVFS